MRLEAIVISYNMRQGTLPSATWSYRLPLGKGEVYFPKYASLLFWTKFTIFFV